MHCVTEFARVLPVTFTTEPCSFSLKAGAAQGKEKLMKDYKSRKGKRKRNSLDIHQIIRVQPSHAVAISIAGHSAQFFLT